MDRIGPHSVPNRVDLKEYQGTGMLFIGRPYRFSPGVDVAWSRIESCEMDRRYIRTLGFLSEFVQHSTGFVDAPVQSIDPPSHAQRQRMRRDHSHLFYEFDRFGPFALGLISDAKAYVCWEKALVHFNRALHCEDRLVIS